MELTKSTIDDVEEPQKSTFDDTSQFHIEKRKLRIFLIENILQEILPLTKDKTISVLTYKTGCAPMKIKEYLKILFANDIISYNENGDLVWNKKK